MAGFVLLLEILAAFFACYCVAKGKGKEQEKAKSDAKNKVSDNRDNIRTTDNCTSYHVLEPEKVEPAIKNEVLSSL